MLFSAPFLFYLLLKINLSYPIKTWRDIQLIPNSFKDSSNPILVFFLWVSTVMNFYLKEKNLEISFFLIFRATWFLSFCIYWVKCQGRVCKVNSLYLCDGFYFIFSIVSSILFSFFIFFFFLFLWILATFYFPLPFSFFYCRVHR